MYYIHVHCKMHLKCHTFVRTIHITPYKQTKRNMNSGVSFQWRPWIGRDVGAPFVGQSVFVSKITNAMKESYSA